MRMSKVEAWRLKELSILLDELIFILNLGRHREWAGVFAHFGRELVLLGSVESTDDRYLRSLVGSMKLCLESGSGFSRLVLEGQESAEDGALNLKFSQLREALVIAVEEIGEMLAEFVN